MRERIPRVLAAICGIIGVLTLVASFNVNPGPPAGATLAQVVDFGKQYHDSILVGAWRQGIGSLLNVIFVLLVRVVASLPAPTPPLAGGTRA